MPQKGKLTEADKAEIKRLREAGMPEYKIAAQFDVAPGTVRWALGKRPRSDKLKNLDSTKFFALLRAAHGNTATVMRALSVDDQTMMDWFAEKSASR